MSDPSLVGLISKVNGGRETMDHYDKVIEIFTQPQQDQQIIQYAEKVSDSLGPGNTSYSACSHNCADFVRDALSAGGIKTDHSLLPNSYYKGVDAAADIPHVSGSIAEGTR